MNSQEARNRKIIDAVIRKEQAEPFGEEDYRGRLSEKSKIGNNDGTKLKYLRQYNLDS